MFSSAGSFKRYTDMKNQDDELEAGRRIANDATHLDHFTHEIDLSKEDLKTIEKLRKKLNDSNEQARTIQRASKMRELKFDMETDLDQVLKLAKNIIHRIEGLDRLLNNNNNNNNPPERRLSSATGPSIERTRISLIMGIGKKLREVMDEFQGLRVRLAAVYKETVENRYFCIAGEKKFIETIENLAANGELEDSLSDAIQEHGRDRVVDFVDEIHERREGSKNMQRNLVELHQMFLDMTSLVETQAHKSANGNGNGNGTGNGNGDHQMVRGNSFLKPAGAAQLQDQQMDYDGEAKRRATIGLVLAVFLVFMIIIPLFVAESNRDME
ncbi:OLC1v1021707C1 [Oldenlandia corymbosa var. corymbosa]|uniref:OLC1v1021707C1 n=1 Tax=Oldenlandia corymbosa var. corymbosa TaxID=529605 RepID=A0AAV1BW98_OLDCO|nr:OLC1v1021707C1 [Oldenlandia corymbosa var. corymbosa]